MKLRDGEIVSILRSVQPQNVIDVVEVLLEQGINVIEVSLSEEEMGLACIEKIKKEFGDNVKLGVGTVINKDQVEKALLAGAEYIITPGWDRELVRYIKAKGILVIPGVYSPSEVMQAVNEGLNLVKLFPAGNLGISYIKNLLGPFPNIKIMAVGGVNKSNIKDFYEAGCKYFGIGSDLVPRGANKESISDIKKSAAEYIEQINKWR